MTDGTLREAERRWTESGSVADEAGYLRARLRAGTLPPAGLEAAALLGHEAALCALGESVEALEDRDPTRALVRGLYERDPRAAARAVLAACRVADRVGHPWARLDAARALLDAVEAWLAGEGGLPAVLEGVAKVPDDAQEARALGLALLAREGGAIELRGLLRSLELADAIARFEARWSGARDAAVAESFLGAIRFAVLPPLLGYAPPALRWWVLALQGAPSGGLYELEVKSYFQVIDRRSGEVVREYEGLYESSYAGSEGYSEGHSSGVSSVTLAPDMRHVIVIENDKERREPLPK